MPPMTLTAATALPADGASGTLVARVWLPVAAPRGDGVYALGREAPTSADLMEAQDPAALVRGIGGTRIGGIAEILANSALGPRDPALPYFLAPVDLQAIKAAGVTFMRSLLERVIEEQTKG